MQMRIESPIVAAGWLLPCRPESSVLSQTNNSGVSRPYLAEYSQS